MIIKATAWIATLFPFILAFVYWYIVLTPWSCQGLCCIFSSSRFPFCPTITLDEGCVDPKFHRVAALFQDFLRVGWDLGASA